MAIFMKEWNEPFLVNLTKGELMRLEKGPIVSVVK
jgi:hypothetical protein